MHAAFCKEHLARYKAPKSVDVVDTLPKSPQGKIAGCKVSSMIYKEMDKTIYTFLDYKSLGDFCSLTLPPSSREGNANRTDRV